MMKRSLCAVAKLVIKTNTGRHQREERNFDLEQRYLVQHIVMLLFVWQTDSDGSKVPDFETQRPCIWLCIPVEFCSCNSWCLSQRHFRRSRLPLVSLFAVTCETSLDWMLDSE